jgi:thioesterase domain-containing protein/acyl carrier protein
VLEREGAEYRFAASIESSNGWVECASARVTADGADEAPVLNLTAIQRRCCDREQTFAHRQNRQQERFFVFGPRWRTLERIAFGGDEALVTLELPPDFTSDLKDYPVHPALLDMATGAAMFLIADYERLGRAYVPVHYGRIRVLKALPARCLSYVRARSAAADSPVASFDVHILDMNGEPVIEIQEFMLRRMDDVRSAGSERSASRTDTQQTRGVGELSRPSVDSIVSSEGIAAFLQILRGSYVSNVVIFPSDFSAYSARAAARFPALHKRADNAQPAETMRDAIERTVAEWWTELLGAQSLTPQSDFFALGGQSLTAVRLFAKIRKTYDLQLSPATIFEAPTIEKLAQRIRGGVAPAAAVSSPSNAVPTPGSTASVLHNSDSRKAKGALIELRRGGPRNLFFVHDGEGEILLYLNLARRMPDNLAVFGIEPRRIAGVPMAHATIEDMASFYLEAVREKQPHGPYLLAGLCAGGTIAYEMASQLARAGERVDLLALLETALPKAKELPGRLAAQRRGRLKQAITDASKGQSAPFRRSLAVAYAITHKLTGALRWEISERGRQLWVSARVHLLREVLARGLAWPRFVPELSVTQIYYAAQARYTPKPLSIPSIVLVRAQAGEGEDTPYREIYADETFGWKSVADRVTCLDVAGGHSTMLQEHFVDSVAKALLPYVRQSGAEILNRALEVV